MEPTDRRPPKPLQSETRPDTGGPSGTPLTRPIESTPFEDRFVDLGELGRGGMGRVHRYHDRTLKRDVAIKFLPAGAEDDPALLEARVVARLQHPNIAPVYEIGECADGRRWLAMREVAGRDLSRLLAEADDAPAGGDLRRLVGLLHRVCEAMAYAHGEGVVHRDLKPSNIRVGDYGDVTVLDWGIAGPVGAERRAAGTRAFMAPEQVDGAPLDPRMDVYALGCILRRVLDRDAAPGSDPLRALARTATADDPIDRPADASVMADALGRWLQGADDREAARRLIAEAEALGPEIDRLKAEAARLRRDAAEALDALPPGAPVSDKEAVWAMEDRAEAASRSAREVEASYENRLDEAWRRSADLHRSRLLLADLYRSRVVEAEKARDDDRVEAYAARLASIDHERRHAHFLSGAGTVTLVTDPPGAEVRAARYELRGRRLVAGEETLLGITPLHDHPLGRGDWQLRITRPGSVDVIYPVSLARGSRWDGIAPGEKTPRPIHLPAVGELHGDECYVPAGWFWSGGDPLAVDGLPRRRFWVDGFVVERHPLTYRRLFDDLEALWRAGQGERARAIMPTNTVYIHFSVHEHGFGARRGQTSAWSLDWPVVELDWFNVRAWAAWRAERTGLPWRLLHSLEWEKAARGTDGRTLPWGDHPESGWANLVDSRATPPGLVPVNEYPTDVGPYGVRGLVGNVRDWCLDAYRRQGSPAAALRVEIDTGAEPGAHQSCRGGGWSSTGPYCRPASRFAAAPTLKGLQIGGRIARSIGDR